MKRIRENRDNKRAGSIEKSPRNSIEETRAETIEKPAKTQIQKLAQIYAERGGPDMHPLTSRNMGEQEEPQSSLCHVFDFDVEGPAKTNYEGETIFNVFFNYARQSQRRYNFYKCRRLCFTSVFGKNADYDRRHNKQYTGST